MKKSAVMNYIRGSAEQISKVTWPTKQQAVRLTFIVLGFCAAFTFILGMLDFALSEAYIFILTLRS